MMLKLPIEGGFFIIKQYLSTVLKVLYTHVYGN
jgi:hypothetical protein